MFRNDCINTNDTPSFSATSWKSWLRAGIALLAADVTELVGLFVIWQKRASSRRALAEMDFHLLSDIGLTREQAIQESGKPFWKG